MIQIISEHAEDILIGFHQHLTAQSSLTDATIGSHIATVRDFFSWYEARTGTSFLLGAAASLSVIHYQAALKGRGVQPATIKRHNEALRCLYQWADFMTVRA